jgi:hypothetical protein
LFSYPSIHPPKLFRLFASRRYTPDYISSVIPLTVIFTLLPFGPLAKGALDLGAAAEKSPDAVSWSRRWDYCQDIEDNQAQVDALTASDPQAYWDFDCVFPVGNILISTLL